MTSNGRPIRVLMLTCAWPPPDRPGYTTTFIRRQVEFLQAAGVDVDVFHFTSAMRPANYLRAWIGARRRTARGRYDLVHAQFGQSGLVALPKRLPLVVTFRGDDLQGIVGRNLEITPAGKVLRTLSRMVARAADACIVVSEHMKAYLPRAVSAHVIPSGLDFDQFRPIPRDEARAQLGLPLDKRLVLFVGNPAVERKRYPLAREAVDILTRSLPADLVVAWKVRHRDVPVWMNACDALVFTSMQEGSPNAVKEALACDLPVVSVPVGDVAQRIGGVAGCELCPDETPESIAAALERVLRRGIRVAGRAAVQDLDERRLAQQVIAVYRSVLSARNGGPAVVAERRPPPVAAGRGAP
jgi:teichuronic acid biosynthesis glycosyltransferase TuaC